MHCILARFHAEAYFPNRTHAQARAVRFIKAQQEARLATAAHTWLADSRRHPYYSPLVLGSARREKHNHRGECDKQHNFHGVAP